MKKQIATLVGGLLIGLATLAATNGLLAAQVSTPTAASAAVSKEATMRQMETPVAMDAAMAAMMDEFPAMMQMMRAMMGGDMAGMMGGEEMPGMASSSWHSFCDVTHDAYGG
jgi:hypothetical protein